MILTTGDRLEDVIRHLELAPGFHRKRSIRRDHTEYQDQDTPGSQVMLNSGITRITSG